MTPLTGTGAMLLAAVVLHGLVLLLRRGSGMYAAGAPTPLRRLLFAVWAAGIAGAIGVTALIALTILKADLTEAWREFTAR